MNENKKTAEEIYAEVEKMIKDTPEYEAFAKEQKIFRALFNAGIEAGKSQFQTPALGTTDTSPAQQEWNRKVEGVDEVEEAAYSHACDQYDVACNEFDDCLKDFRAGAHWMESRLVSSDKWIRVEDRLPEKTQHVSGCRTLLNGQQYILPVFWNNADMVFLDRNTPIDLTHWQPLLPAPNSTPVSENLYTEEEVIGVLKNAIEKAAGICCLMDDSLNILSINPQDILKEGK